MSYQAAQEWCGRYVRIIGGVFQLSRRSDFGPIDDWQPESWNSVPTDGAPVWVEAQADLDPDNSPPVPFVEFAITEGDLRVGDASGGVWRVSGGEKNSTLRVTRVVMRTGRIVFR